MVTVDGTVVVTVDGKVMIAVDVVIPNGAHMDVVYGSIFVLVDGVTVDAVERIITVVAMNQCLMVVAVN